MDSDVEENTSCNSSIPNCEDNNNERETKRKLSENEVVSSVVEVYNRKVEDNIAQPPVIMDLAEIMEKVQDFEPKNQKQKSLDDSVLSAIETLQVIKKETPQYICVFCKTGVVDELRVGKLYFRGGVVTHYFCMLFSAALCQKGEDAAGILGFLVEDIMTEVRRSYRLKCVYCNKSGASIGCCTRRCKAAYHYACGLQNGVNYQFFGNFQTYCFDHRNFQKMPQKQIKEKGCKEGWTCSICYCEAHQDRLHTEVAVANCCKKIFHRLCLQKMALSAGYFFKCPTCNDRAKFVKEMKSFGIYVPEQDASWEKDNAFQDLYVQYSNCDANECLCPNGRNFSADKGDWSLARCRLCGGAGTHKKCSTSKSIANWACDACIKVEKAAIVARKLQPKITKTPVRAQSEPGPSCSARTSMSSSHSKKRSRIVVSNDESSDDEEDFDFTTIKLHSPASDYFPYTREKLAALQEKGDGSLRDWRKLSLHVQLCDIMHLIQTKVVKREPNLNGGRSVLVTKNGPSTLKQASLKRMKTGTKMNLNDTDIHESVEVWQVPAEDERKESEISTSTLTNGNGHNHLKSYSDAQDVEYGESEGYNDDEYDPTEGQSSRRRRKRKSTLPLSNQFVSH